MLLDFIKKKNKKKELPLPLLSNRIHQILFYNEVIIKTQNLDGAIIECGVGWGRSAFLISEISGIFNLNKKILLCDTYGGFPELSQKDREIPGIKKGYYNAPIEHVKNYFDNSKITNKKNIEYVIGDIKESLKNFDDKICLLNLDMDIYSSYEFALKNLIKNVVKGGAVIIDEYNSKKWSNIRQLVDLYLPNEKFGFFKSNFPLFNRVYFIKL
tara:strand:- start:1017 stop:1655 length:639 start_codon:yes stop_codon:yes gene_type:complete